MFCKIVCAIHGRRCRCRHTTEKRRIQFQFPSTFHMSLLVLERQTAHLKNEEKRENKIK